jgi:TonB family protein
MFLLAGSVATPCSGQFGDDAFSGRAISYARRPVTIYVDELTNKIAKYWNPEGGERALPATVAFSVESNGSLTKLRLTRSSKIAKLDRAAIRAIQAIAPLKPLPKASLSPIELEVSFSTAIPGPTYLPTTPGSKAVYVNVINLNSGRIVQTPWSPAPIESASETTLQLANRLLKRIKDKWKPPKIQRESVTIVRAKIGSNGNISGLQLEKSSASLSFDSVAIRTVQAALSLECRSHPMSHSALLGVIFLDNPKLAHKSKTENATSQQEVSLPNVGVSAQEDIDFGPYMQALRKKIESVWNPASIDVDRKAAVVFKVHQDGHVSHSRLDYSSGDSAVDQAALRAIEQAGTFQPLPERAPDIDVQFTFHNAADPAKQRRFRLSISMPSWIGVGECF